jgi:peptidyl-tRNA hydrolase, PTH2 family
MPKVVLHGESATELSQLERQAREAGLPAALIKDAGHTVVAPGTITCLAIGPGEQAAIDRLTGEKKLVR